MFDIGADLQRAYSDGYKCGRLEALAELKRYISEMADYNDKADRKTENSSEKPNNCEICKHWEYDAKYKWWHCPLQDNGMYECHYEPRKLTAVEDEPQTETQTETQNSNLTFEMQTDCPWK